MSYQVRHKVFGIFQGHFIGLGLWYPASHTPEQGLFEFCSIECSCKFIRCICESGDCEVDEFSVEPFDAGLSVSLQMLSVLCPN